MQTTLTAKEPLMGKVNKYYAWFVAGAIMYCGLILFLPPDAAILRKYGVSAVQIKELDFGLAIPILAIWFLGFVGFINMKRYAKIIRKNKDGKAMALISDGLAVLAIGNLLLSIISSYFSYIETTHRNWAAYTTIFSNYASLAVMFGAVYLIYRGTEELLKFIKKRPATISELAVVSALIAFIVIFVYATLHNPYRQFPPSSTVKASYYLPDFLIVLTIILPYIGVWFYGLRAVSYLHNYSQKVSGVLYRRALNYVASGIGIVIVSSMLIRFLVSFTSTLNNLTLKALLVLLYILVGIIGIGFGLVALGAQKLQKIEEV